MEQTQAKALLRTSDILPLLSDIASHRQEHFIVLSVDSGQRVITKRTIFIGTINSIIVHPREIYAGAIADFAASIVIAHNHPSGDPTPSNEDIATTQQLVAAGQLLGIPVRDHVIVAKGEQFSFREHSLIG